MTDADLDRPRLHKFREGIAVGIEAARHVVHELAVADYQTANGRLALLDAERILRDLAAHGVALKTEQERH